MFLIWKENFPHIWLLAPNSFKIPCSYSILGNFSQISDIRSHAQYKLFFASSFPSLIQYFFSSFQSWHKINKIEVLIWSTKYTRSWILSLSVFIAIAIYILLFFRLYANGICSLPGSDHLQRHYRARLRSSPVVMTAMRSLVIAQYLLNAHISFHIEL